MAEIRQLMLSEDVTESSVKEIILKIREWNKQDDEQEEKLKKYERPVIELLINTYGGEIFAGNALISAITTSKTKVHTICIGHAKSMGFSILISGHKRFAHSMDSIMYHQLSHGVRDTLKQMEWTVEEDKIVQRGLNKFIIKKTNITKKQLKSYNDKNKNWYMTAKQALKLGVIDEIIKKGEK